MSENTVELPAILSDSVILPHMATSVELKDDSTQVAVKAAADNESELLLLFPLPDREEAPLAEQFHHVGVTAQLQFMQRSDGQILIAQGIQRAEVLEIVQEEPYLICKVTLRPDPEAWEEETEKLRREVMAYIETFIELTPGIPEEILNFVRSITEPGHLADNTGYTPEYSNEQRLELLETFDVHQRLVLVRDFFKQRIAFAQVQAQIREQAKTGVEKSQREFILREQLKAIREELGETDEMEAEIDEYRKKIAEVGLSEEATKEANRELSRMEKMPPQAAEYSVIKTYLDWLTDLPWGNVDDEVIDIPQGRQVLDEDHYDLQEVKDRILEFLAVRKLAMERGSGELAPEERRGAILCFVGPPGVGKTSLGRSIARAMGREFTRMSLGGMRDEAEIRGHRRTYIGAMPGRIIQSIRRAGSRRPVFMLDEVDKLGSDWRGDPSSALLEVLDPEQNSTFRDHYLDVDYDLSQVMFIATANLLEPIPPALRDRMEILYLDGYVEHEKVLIAQEYLVPRQRRANSLEEDELSFEDEALQTIIRDYTREAGVRQLEREIGRVSRKVATKIASGETQDSTTVDAEMTGELLGKPRFYFEAGERTEIPGVVTGLSVSQAGGDVLFIEASKMNGAGKLTLTGQLGDVMRESANLALSFVKARAERLGLDSELFESSDMHVHVPAGSIPKDGPSAGVAIVTAIVSLFTRTCVNSNVAMTGEITLRGRVLPVGGIKQKVLAAHRADLKTVILPHRNEADLDDLPDEVREEMEFILVKTIDEVLEHALPGVKVAEAV
jgi:ATP-dependent Lon protease